MGQFAILDVVGFPIQRNWYVVHARGKQLSIVASTFLEFLKQAPKHVLELPCYHAERSVPVLTAKPGKKFVASDSN